MAHPDAFALSLSKDVSPIVLGTTAGHAADRSPKSAAIAGQTSAMIALLLILQSAAPAVAAPQPERWSILTPTPSEPCVPARRPGDKDDIVICANAKPSPRLPDPDSVPSKGPVKSNPYLTGIGALAAMDTPCPISRNCVVGFGPPIVPLIKGAVDVAKRAFRRKPDKTGRVAIPLDDKDAPTARLEP